MENDFLIITTWAITASIAALYYSARATKLRRAVVASTTALIEIAEGNAVIIRTKEGISIKAKDNEHTQ